jgi:hypothetical protein
VTAGPGVIGKQGSETGRRVGWITSRLRWKNEGVFIDVGNINSGYADLLGVGIEGHDLAGCGPGNNTRTFKRKTDMKIGVALKIDVTKLDKARFFKGQKGTYAHLTAFIDTENVSEYGDNGVITQSTSQEERQNGVKLPILGNAKVFYTDGQSQNNQVPAPGREQNQGSDYNQDQPLPNDDIPF